MDYLTSKQLAEQLHVKHATIRQWIARKKVKGEKVANTWLIHKSEVQRLLANNKGESNG